MESQKKDVIVSVHMNHDVSTDIIEMVEQQEKTETVSCQNYDEFVHNVTLDTTVLDGLISKCCLTNEDSEDIMNERRLSERNRMILNILMARPYGTFQTFSEELLEFDRSKIDLVSKMKNYDCEGEYNLAVFEVMNLSSHTIKLQKNFKILVNELATTNTIVDHLISDEVLCLEDQAEVCAQGNTKEQSNRLLLTKLMYKNADAYTHFLSALEEDTCYEELSKRIKNTEVTDEDKIKIHIGRITAKENKEKHTRDIHKREQTENVIPRNIQDQHNVLIEQWRNEDDSFVCTRAADEVLKRIRNNISVIVSGNSGVGKTATMRHVALLLKKEGYRIIPTCTPKDLRRFSQKGVKTLFVIDDICGHFTLNDNQVDKWEEILAIVQPFLEQNPCKIIATCRLQVFKDAKFKVLSLFNSSECNLNSETIKFTKEELSKLAEMYFKEHADEVKGLSDQFDFFPLLCKLYQKSNCKEIKQFFHNPFEFYRNEIESLRIEGEGGKLKYCCLVLCVLFNNRIAEKQLQSQDIHTQDLMEKTFIECKLNKGTSVECLKDSFKTLEDTLLTKVDGTYRTIHDKLFDFLAQIVVRNNVDLCISNCSSDFIRERFIWNPVFTSQDNTNLSITLFDTHVYIYIHRLIQDWTKGLTASVFCNINMKNHEFIDKLMKALNNLDASEKKRLAQKTDNESRDSPLLLSSFIGNVSLTKWLLENTGIPAKSKNLREVVSRVNRNNYLHPHINMQRENGTTSLYIACENGHLELLKMLLRYGADATIKKNTDDSPLSVACENGHTTIVNEILRITDVDKDYQNKNGYSPLYFACQNGHAQIVQNLLIHKANINLCTKLDVSPLFIACEKGYLSIVKNLLSYGANINRQNNTGQVPLHAACYKNHLEVVRMLLDKDNISVNILDNKNISPLYATCQCSKGHFEAMELLLEHNADVNFGRQPLIMTCANGNIKMSKQLIEHKADVNSCLSDGVSPLFIACQHRHYETVCLLFQYNADPNVHRENCASPLMIASQNGDVETVEKLLKHGCNINRCTADGVSSLYLASQNGHSHVVFQLIEAGANLDMSDTDGKTALFKACQNGHLEIVLKLLTCKANAHLRMVNNVTPMEIAEKNKHLEIMKVLKKHEIDEKKLSWE
ncbi:uncharacterized protein LOC134690009 [Mytilus trossulus]|uniref:uncharacterized protein LOC134690009 n=1 Tax=Mytilus trossulus TaxID=6551 RepID=UPI0030076254